MSTPRKTTIDGYYSPNWVADILADTLPANFSGMVLDPSAGSGSLLEAVGRRHSEGVDFAATDLDRSAIDLLKRRHPTWRVSKVDVLDKASRRASPLWKELKEKSPHVVLLNPPFSYRGPTGVLSTFDGFHGRLTPAAAFVAILLSEINPVAGIRAVLPDGVVRGERYEPFWEAVGLRFEVSIVEHLRPQAFQGARARTSIVSIVPRLERMDEVDPGHISALRGYSARGNAICTCVDLIRGRIGRHAQFEEGALSSPFVHTTDLSGSTPINRFAPTGLATRGPFVLIPRVGNPRSLKLLVVDTDLNLVLSDCLYAIRPLEPSSLAQLAENLSLLRDRLSLEYKGTGASYLTIKSMLRFLSEMGLNARHVSASGPNLSCTCGRLEDANLSWAPAMASN